MAVGVFFVFCVFGLGCSVRGGRSGKGAGGKGVFFVGGGGAVKASRTKIIKF